MKTSKAKQKSTLRQTRNTKMYGMQQKQEAEYTAINSMLGQINSCLDHLEEKNGHIHARLRELLEYNQ
ncbi:unnamed protein product [Nyctereutes procyonoides]|uniref:(raccoon dog) hypothetical protein n=1 Tax=Nyctereutes procyonoides TaxID=34880 RepID=A0A812A0T8_NYCPR|nr:unnamed protein product [Nyctereutes procyonoides]